jgi:hypothetical protein
VGQEENPSQPPNSRDAGTPASIAIALIMAVVIIGIVADWMLTFRLNL